MKTKTYLTILSIKNSGGGIKKDKSEIHKGDAAIFVVEDDKSVKELK